MVSFDRVYKRSDILKKNIHPPPSPQWWKCLNKSFQLQSWWYLNLYLVYIYWLLLFNGVFLKGEIFLCIVQVPVYLWVGSSTCVSKMNRALILWLLIPMVWQKYLNVTFMRVLLKLIDRYTTTKCVNHKMRIKEPMKGRTLAVDQEIRWGVEGAGRCSYCMYIGNLWDWVTISWKLLQN